MRRDLSKRIKKMTDEKRRKAYPKLVYEMRFKEKHCSIAKESVVTLTLDEETIRFLDSCRASMFNEISYFMALILERCFAKTDVNGFLGRGSMFVLSTAHAKKLLHLSSKSSLLDIGAGGTQLTRSATTHFNTTTTTTTTDGNVTQNLSTLFRRVVTTEVSLPMCKRLRNRGWECIQTDLPSRTNINHETFDVVSLLNVLDRCDRPRTLLQRIRELLKPQGRLLLAVVLPFCPFVESGVKKLQPRELLPLRGGLCPCSLPPIASKRYPTFETCVSHMIQDVLVPAGYDVESVSRVPYLCKGGRYSAPYYVLQDAIFVLKNSERKCDVTMKGDAQLLFPAV